MSREDLHKLLGGYATGNLTPHEQEALFTAALDDQELFDALAREQSLRDLLRDPTAKAHLLAALDRRPAPWWARWWRPAAVGLGMAAVIVLAVIAVQNIAPAPKVPIMAVAKPQQTAEIAPAAPPAAAIAPLVTEEPRAKTSGQKRLPEREKLVAADASVKLESRNEAPAAQAAPPPPPPPPKAESAPQAPGVGGVVGGIPPITIEPAPATQIQNTGKELKSVDERAQSGISAAQARASAQERKTELAAADAKSDAFDQALSARRIFLRGAQTVDLLKSRLLEQNQQQAQSQRARASGQQGFKAGAPGEPEQSGMRYSILTTSGRPQLRLETNGEGFLYAMARGNSGSWRTLFSGATAPLQPRIIGGLQPDEKEIYVVFSREVREIKGGPAPPEPGDVPDTNLVESDGDTTYVVNPLAGDAGRSVRFTIRLL